MANKYIKTFEPSQNLLFGVSFVVNGVDYFWLPLKISLLGLVILIVALLGITLYAVSKRVKK